MKVRATTQREVEQRGGKLGPVLDDVLEQSCLLGPAYPLPPSNSAKEIQTPTLLESVCVEVSVL